MVVGEDVPVCVPRDERGIVEPAEHLEHLDRVRTEEDEVTERPPSVNSKTTSVVEDLKDAFRHVGSVPGLRWVIVMSLAANFFIVGPFEIGLPVIAYQRLPEGAAAFGILLSAFGGGSLVGLALGAMLPAPRPSRCRGCSPSGRPTVPMRRSSPASPASAGTPATPALGPAAMRLSRGNRIQSSPLTSGVCWA